MTGGPELSIVLGTLNRLPLLMRCLDSARAAAGALPHEIVVVDGGSTDGTAEYLCEQPDLRVIWQGGRRGAVAAFNAGFAAARGAYVAHLNDDAFCVGPLLAEAVALLRERPEAGQVALPFQDPRHAPAVHYIRAGRLSRRYLYANFGVTRRDLGERLGWWGAHSEHYGGDTELSLQIWRAGYQVIPLLPRADCYLDHLRAEDGTRVENSGEGRRLGLRWRDWDGVPER